MRQMRAFRAARPMHEDTTWLFGHDRITDGVTLATTGRRL
jgi:hypothetical protein